MLTVCCGSKTPKYGVDSNASVRQFIDQYINCAIPEDEGKLKDLVLLLQQHKYSTYCRHKKHCLFNFPHPPCNDTLISEPGDGITDCIDVLTQVYETLAANPNGSINELLSKANVTLDQYVSALQVSTKFSVVILKHRPSECNINKVQCFCNVGVASQHGYSICPQYLCMCHVCGLLHNEV